MTELPARAEIVIIGAGVIGASVAYHLTALGRTDVLVLEQGRISGGTTWHAAGLVGQLRASESGTRLVQYSTQLYAGLEAETGLSAGYKRSGGVTVARTEDRMIQLRRTAASAAAYDLECELLSPAQARERYPLIDDSDLVGAIWLPGDGTANPTDLTSALAKGARQRGARIVEKVRVIGVDTADGAVSRVRTDQGDVEAAIVVNCAGQWAKAVGAFCGVNVPLHSAEHFYVVTSQLDGVTRDLPILRDPDGYTYFKEEVGALVVGGFEPEAKPWVSPEDLPYPFEFQLLGEDWEHFAILMQSAQRRIPALLTTGIKKFYNGPESFTPDNQFILGEAPEVRNYFVGAGFNSVGIASAGGAGKALAEWIVSGSPQQDLVGVDIRRFAPFHGNSQWLRGRVGEVLGLHYALGWPNREFDSARPFRRSPAYDLLQQQGAIFGSKMGWERANVFAPSPGTALDYSWGTPNWQAWSDAEQRATRSGVAIYDQTSFGKLEISGRDAVAALQWLCTADVDVPIGQAVYTGMLNERGGYEADVTLTRLAATTYLLVTGAGSVRRDADHIQRQTPDGLHVTVTDVSSALAVYGVMGPGSRDLLQGLTRADLSSAAFGFATSREIDLGVTTVRATRMTYVGELGWELYVPSEFAHDVYELLTSTQLTDADAVTPAGYYAMNSLRLEVGYRAFGSELTPDYGPIEAGLGFTCKTGTSIGFLGRAGVERARTEGTERRLVTLTLGEHDRARSTAWGGELILRDATPAGQLTSAAWAAGTGAIVGLGYVRAPAGQRLRGLAQWREYLTAGRYEVDLAGERVLAHVSLEPPRTETSFRL